MQIMQFKDCYVKLQANIPKNLLAAHIWLRAYLV